MFFPLPFPRDLLLDGVRAFLLASERKLLLLAAVVGFVVGFFVDFLLDFFCEFDFTFNLVVVAVVGFMLVWAMAVPLVAFFVFLPSPLTFLPALVFPQGIGSVV